MNQETVKTLNPVEIKKAELLEHIKKMVANDGFYKKSTCDAVHYGWNLDEFFAMKQINSEGISGMHISVQISFGVTDYFIQRTE